MSRLTDALARLTAMLTPPVGPTNGTKIFEPVQDDPSAPLKRRVIDKAHRAIQLGNAAIDNQPMPAQLIENELFMELDGLSDNDAERPDYFELINAAQEVLVAANGPAA